MLQHTLDHIDVVGDQLNVLVTNAQCENVASSIEDLLNDAPQPGEARMKLELNELLYAQHPFCMENSFSEVKMIASQLPSPTEEYSLRLLEAATDLVFAIHALNHSLRKAVLQYTLDQ